MKVRFGSKPLMQSNFLNLLKPNEPTEKWLFEYLLFLVQKTVLDLAIEQAVCTCI